MPLHSLAAVELQLLMQCLDRQSLLDFARCSCVLRAAASHPFAWKHIIARFFRCKGCEPPQAQLEWNAPAARIPTPLTMARRYSSSLLRFAGCRVWWSLTPGTVAELRAQVAGVSTMPRIVELNVTASSSHRANVRLSSAEIALLADGLLRHSAATLTQLNLCGSRIGDEGAEVVARLVRAASRLQALLLDHAEIGAAGWCRLGLALRQSSCLEVLSLNGMPTGGDACALAIADALAKSTSLQQVLLRDCRIGDAGAAALASALRDPVPR